MCKWGVRWLQGTAVGAVLALAFCLPVAAGAVALEILPASATCSTGETVAFDLTVDDSTNVAGFQFDIEYGTLVHVESCTRGAAVSDSGTWDFRTSSPGGTTNTIRVMGYARDPSVDYLKGGSAALAHIVFHANATPGTASLDLKAATLGDQQGTGIPVTPYDGQITISAPNSPPVLDAIGNQSVDEGGTLTFTVTASDPDGDALSYSASNLPSGATFDPATQVFTWTPGYDQAGSYPGVHFEVSDGSLTDSEDITITVNNVNRAPLIYVPDDKRVECGETLTFTVTASDPDSDPVTLSAENLPTGATFDPGTGEFSWTPTSGQVGEHQVDFSAWDGLLTATDSLIITVTQGNRAPVLDTIGAQSVNEGDTLTFTVTASDPDGDSLSYSASNLPSGATFDPATRVFTWTPGYDQAGSYPGVHFEVSDGSLTDSEDITITVNNVNRAPVLEAIGYQSVYEGGTLTFTVTASDPDGDALSYSASNLPSGATFDPATRAFTWTPGYDQAGSYPGVHFEVSDGSLTDSEDITITVNNVNRAPVLEAIGNQSVDEGGTLTFTVTASDPDGDALSYSASNLPTGATFDPATRVFTWTPGYSQAGTYAGVTFTVTDGTVTDSETITITVVDVPQCSIAIAGLQVPAKARAGRAGTVTVKVTNTGDVLCTVSVTLQRIAPTLGTALPPQTINIKPGRTSRVAFSYPFTNADAPACTLRATATCSCGQVVTAEATVTVTAR